mgnify:CR=1 FL=1
MNELLQSLQARLGPNAKAIRALMAPLVVVMILAMMVLPLPAMVLHMSVIVMPWRVRAGKNSLTVNSTYCVVLPR